MIRSIILRIMIVDGSVSFVFGYLTNSLQWYRLIYGRSGADSWANSAGLSADQIHSGPYRDCQMVKCGTIEGS